MENYIIYVENSVIGTKLSLDKNSKIESTFSKWAVEENLNGLSVPSNVYNNTIEGKICDYIYGFYKKNTTVTLHFYGKNGKKEKTTYNVTIKEKEK